MDVQLEAGERINTVGQDMSLKQRKSKKLKETLIEKFFLLNGVLAILILLGIFSLLFIKGFPAIRELGLKSFFGSAVWNPNAYGTPKYGILSLIVSTLMVTVGALVIAVPLGVACAAFLSELAPPRLREILKPAVEILAGIPSVVVGFLGIVLVNPLISKVFGISNGLNALNGAILLAVMSLPTIISLSEDALRAVPQTYKEASLALGANRWQTLDQGFDSFRTLGNHCLSHVGYGKGHRRDDDRADGNRQCPGTHVQFSGGDSNHDRYHRHRAG